jgi:phospholipid transport system substrate-binding protein
VKHLANDGRARRFGLALAVAAVVLLLHGGAHAQGGGTPMATVKSTLTASNKIVTGPGDHNTKLAKLKELLRDFLDTDALGRKSMGKHLDGKSEAQTREFLDLFRELFIRTYVQRLLLFEAPDFEYGEEKVKGDEAIVNTFIVTPRDKFAADYDLEKKSAGWIATDIRIEGVSLAQNFKSQFDRALAKKSFDELLTQLRNKLRSGDSNGGTD